LVDLSLRYCDCSNFQDGRRRHLGFDATVFGFLNRKILFADGGKRVKTHQRAKFRQNWSISCEDSKFFLIFQDGGRPPLGIFWASQEGL